MAPAALLAVERENLVFHESLEQDSQVTPETSSFLPEAPKRFRLLKPEEERLSQILRVLIGPALSDPDKGVNRLPVAFRKDGQGRLEVAGAAFAEEVEDIERRFGKPGVRTSQSRIRRFHFSPEIPGRLPNTD